jgi:AraC-like DNA-binding protein
MPYEHFTNAVGLQPDAADDPDGSVDFDSVLKLLELIAAETDNDAFGVQFADACPICPINLHHFIIFNAPTLADALANRARYSKFVSNAYSVELQMTETACSFSWNLATVTGPRRQFVGYAAALFSKYVRSMLQNEAWLPLQVDLPHKTPLTISEFTRVLGPRIYFDAPALRVHINPAILSQILPAADPDLYRQLSGSINQLINSAAPTLSVLDRTREYIVKSSTYARTDEDTVAQAIGVSVRTLQRDLAEAGTTFRALTEDCRKKAALQLLHDTDLPLTEIAFLLGFSELSAFSRAARTWFGQPASSLRKNPKGTIDC